MAISIPNLGGLISRFIPVKTDTKIQTPTTPEQTTTPTPLTESERVSAIQSINNAERSKLTPDQALNLDQEYLNSSAPDHPNAREATTDEIVGDRTLGDHNWFAKRDAEVKGKTFQEGQPPKLYDTANETVPSVDTGEGKA